MKCHLLIAHWRVLGMVSGFSKHQFPHLRRLRGCLSPFPQPRMRCHFKPSALWPTGHLLPALHVSLLLVEQGPGGYNDTEGSRAWPEEVGVQVGRTHLCKMKLLLKHGQDWREVWGSGLCHQTENLVRSSRFRNPSNSHH